MVGQQASRIGPVVRWLLLVSTVFGLAMMHTLGHAGRQPAAAGHGHAHAAPGEVTTITVPEVAAGLTAASDCDCGTHGAMDMWAICLAVLGSLTIVVLLALMLGGRRHRSGRPGRAATFAGTPRSPPVRVGLTVASTAVLRI